MLSICLSFCTTECGPGKYKGKITATNNYCTTFNHGNDACVTCPGQTGYGNSQSLCVNDCDGITNVPNDEDFACGELMKYLSISH